MKSSSIESESMKEYFTGINGENVQIEDASSKILTIRHLVKSAQCHFIRFARPQKRLLRALEVGDKIAIRYEKECMSIILYEILDTVYCAFSLLDLNQLDVQAAANGTGITGDHALSVIEIFQNLEEQCRQALELEKKYDLQLDFSTPVDEKEGITFKGHRHWQDYVPGSVEQSFFRYFAEMQRRIIMRLNQRPEAWTPQSLRQTMVRYGHKSLLQALHKLESQALWSKVSPSLRKPDISDVQGAQPAGTTPRHVQLN